MGFEWDVPLFGRRDYAAAPTRPAPETHSSLRIIVVAVEIVYAEGQRPEAQALRIEGYAPFLERPHPEERGLGRRPGQVPGDLLEAPDPDHAG